MVGPDPRGSDSRPDWQFRLRAPGVGGSLGFLGAQKVLGLGGQRKEKEKESFFLLQKVVLRRCFRV